MMKNFILTIATTLLVILPSVGFPAYGREYLPILELGKEWTYIGYCVSGELQEPYEPFGFQAVEMIEEDGHDVFLLLPSGTDRDSIDPSEEYLYLSRAYEEDGVLWLFSIEAMKYQPMVDFNLEVGDYVTKFSKVISKECVDVEGVERCVIAIQTPGMDQVYYWCEGVGAINDCFLSPMIASPGERTYMTQCKMGETCLFDHSRMDDYLSEVKPISERTANASITDLLGRRISTPAPGQLYIQDGKKKLATKP